MTEPVVRSALADVLADLDRLRHKVQGLIDDIDGAQDVVYVPKQGRWTREMFATVCGRLADLEGVQALLDVGCENPGQVIGYHQVRQRSGLKEMDQRNAHGRLSRVSRELFDVGWPIEGWQASDEMKYRMSPVVAMWWKEMR